MLFAVYVQGQRNLERLSALFLLNGINRGACFLSYIVISCCSFMTGIGPIDETACWPVPSPLSRLIREEKRREEREREREMVGGGRIQM